MDGYLQACAPGQGCRVVLGGRAVWIDRARMGLHLQLSEVQEQAEDALAAQDAVGAASAMRRYLELAGADLGGATGPEVLVAYSRLSEMNGLQLVLAFMAEEPPPAEELAYDYKGRVYAWWVHKLASRYGWSREEIFALWPEEAACYLQEIFVAEYDEADDQRRLSELAYHVDRDTNTVTYRPLVRPPWMVGKKAQRVVRVRRDMLPVGNVVDLSGGLGVFKDGALPN